ncbi:AMP-binding protein [Bradyrhizobium sp. CB1717]|uniref:AMP-binding protein n=1 Tax=Bradyrhizobium sp. CB1717 TaxID=3039154 RepID=UPI0024B04157|nr:AMP-binding protein [Bradyrhizobium sp. CB1717]WFU23334.1 AMP-binding protein [Bradyrhizobium sp. CB1717]
MNRLLDLCNLIDRNATYARDNTAIHFEEQPLSYVSLNRQTERIARAFNQLGVRKGERIAILRFSRPHFVGLQWSMRTHRPILSRSKTARNQASLSASPRRSKFSIVASRSLSDRFKISGGRGCRGS